GATLAAYAIGLIPFVLIRSAVATFYARKDTATPVRASLTGIAVNVALKLALMGSLAQIGLALATAVGVWTNLLLVLFFAVRRGFLVLDRAWLMSLGKFLLTGIILAVAFWLIARFSGPLLGSMHFRDEVTLVLLAAGGTIVYALAILVLFGRKWLVSLVRG
ncbi:MULTISPECIES: lipid II flippase MurJ, partial [unclassified Bradyrhizobium]|uniref:lipid II flippase MurJ n=1 Tax=unclassified Bradyrhizobium TaxID=2631580 RepID=UPI001FF262D9